MLYEVLLLYNPPYKWQNDLNRNLETDKSCIIFVITLTEVECLYISWLWLAIFVVTETCDTYIIFRLGIFISYVLLVKRNLKIRGVSFFHPIWFFQYSWSLELVRRVETDQVDLISIQELRAMDCELALHSKPSYICHFLFRLRPYEIMSLYQQIYILSREWVDSILIEGHFMTSRHSCNVHEKCSEMFMRENKKNYEFA
jgi:hypothetical protein